MSEKTYTIAIIGAGPAGIAAAIESYSMGLKEIVLLEKDENHNATIRKFYKDNKRVDKDWKGQKVELDGTIYFVDGTKESTLDFFDSLLDHHKIELKTHTEVQKVVKTDEGFDVMIAGGVIKARYVVVTIGRMGKPNKPDYTIPPSLRPLVGYTLEGCTQGEKVMVVGGGDSAIEYAVELSDRNEVFLSYRRGTFRRANPTNQADIARAIEQGGVKALLNTEITELSNHEGKIMVHFSDQTTMIVDRIVYAIGGTTPSGFLASSGILEVEGKPVHNEYYETNIAGLFVAGDITQESGGSIALGLNHGFAIASYLTQKEG